METKQIVNIYDMPGVIAIIRNAEKKIQAYTGHEASLVPSTESCTIVPRKKKILQETVCEFFGVSWMQVTSKSRKENVLYARYCYAWIAVKILQQTMEETGGEIGGRDHSTVCNAIKVMTEHNKNADKWSVKLDECTALFYQLTNYKSNE